MDAEGSSSLAGSRDSVPHAALMEASGHTSAAKAIGTREEELVCTPPSQMCNPESHPPSAGTHTSARVRQSGALTRLPQQRPQWDPGCSVPTETAWGGCQSWSLAVGTEGPLCGTAPWRLPGPVYLWVTSAGTGP